MYNPPLLSERALDRGPVPGLFHVRGSVSAYRRGASHTASQLSRASSREMNRIVHEIVAAR